MGAQNAAGSGSLVLCCSPSVTLLTPVLGMGGEQEHWNLIPVMILHILLYNGDAHRPPGSFMIVNEATAYSPYKAATATMEENTEDGNNSLRTI